MNKSYRDCIAVLTLATAAITGPSSVGAASVWIPDEPERELASDQATDLALDVAQGISSIKQPLELNPKAPETYVVVAGDTLWSIAARYLDDPAQWPRLWQASRDQITNPHRIYPGDTLKLDRVRGQLQVVSKAKPSGPTEGGSAVLAAPNRDEAFEGDTVKLSPSIRYSNVVQPITTVPLTSIEAFMMQPLAVETEQLKGSGRILASADQHVYLGPGDRAYARQIDLHVVKGVKNFQVYRPGKPIIHPETRQILAYEAEHLGQATLVRGGDPATIEVTWATREIGPGDRLLPAEKPQLPLWTLRAPNKPVQGEVVGVYGGVNQAGKHMVVTLNVGKTQGLEPGHVVPVWQPGRVIKDVEDNNRAIKLPDERIGHVVVFRVFNQIAYAVVMSAKEPIELGAKVAGP